MARRRLYFVSALATLVLVACGTAATTSGTPTPVADKSLEAVDASIPVPTTPDACEVPWSKPAPGCGAQCGNGAVNDCSPPCQGGGMCAPDKEECDGAELAERSCTGLGFQGGSLTCDGCFFDVGQCEACVTNPKTRACTRAGVDMRGGRSVDVALAEGGGAMVWLASPTSTGGSSARFARFGADLAVRGETELAGPCALRRIAIGASPSGFIVAMETWEGLVVAPVDGNGAARGPTRLVPNGAMPMLVSRGTSGTMSGGPLLVWSQSVYSGPNTQIYQKTQAAMLHDDGTEEAPPLVVWPAALDTARGRPSAAFAGDGFLVTRDNVALDAYSEVVKVGLNGQELARHSVPGYAKYPVVAWGGGEARIVYNEQGGRFWLRLDGSGAAVGTPVRISDQMYSTGPIAIAGQDTLVIDGPLSEMGDATLSEVKLLRVSADGAVLSTLEIAKDPVVNRSFIEPMGTSWLVSWFSSSTWPGTAGRDPRPARIGLALVDP